MLIRRNLIGCLALFIALGGTSYAATHLARGHHSCNSKGTTLAQDAVGRFYSTKVMRPDGSVRHFYVCAFTQGTSRSVHRSFSSGRGGSPFPWDPSATASGRYVAFFVIGGPNPCDGVFWVQVDDMVTGHSTFRQGPSHGPICGQASLVLKPNGSVAWLVPQQSQTGTTWSVNRHDSTGTAIVDSGPQIDPHSLASGGTWLYWTNAGSPRSARFH